MITKKLTLASGTEVTISQLSCREVQTLDDKLNAVARGTNAERMSATMFGIAMSINKSGGELVTQDALMDMLTFGDVADLNEEIAKLNGMTISKAGEVQAV